MTSFVGSTYGPHNAMPRSRGEAPCSGTLRFCDGQGGFEPMLLVECDRCGMEYGLPRQHADPDYLGRRLFEVSGLGALMAERELEPRDEQRRARAVLRAFLEDTGKPPVLWGPAGTGKTHLLHRLGRALCFNHERRVRYFPVPEWVRARKSGFDRKGVDVYQIALDADVLLLDDLGAERKTDWTESELQDLIYARHEAEKPIVGATNLEPEAWPDHFGERAASRLAGGCEPVLVGGADLRLAE